MSNESGFQVAGDAAANYERFIGTFMKPWAEALVATAQIQPDEHVVDLACGTGFVARSAATATSNGGHVIGVDVNAPMLDIARTIGSFDVIEASAEDTGLDANSVDVVLCQQGLQYFPDTPAALSESTRYLRPGGRCVFSVWAPFSENPFFKGQADAVGPFLPEVETSLRATNIDALQGPDGVNELLAAAGYTDVTLRMERLTVDIPPMVTFFAEFISATPWAPAFDQLTESNKQTVREHMETVAVPHPDGDHSTMEMTSFIASAKLP